MRREKEFEDRRNRWAQTLLNANDIRETKERMLKWHDGLDQNKAAKADRAHLGFESAAEARQFIKEVYTHS